MSLLGDIVARIKTNCPEFSNRVSIARSLNNPDPTVLPECWVHRWISVANGPSTTFGKVTQAATRQVGVMYATAMEDEGDSVDHHEAARDELMTTLLGYEVGSAPLPLEFINEEFVKIEEGYTIQRLVFGFIEHIRNY